MASIRIVVKPTAGGNKIEQDVEPAQTIRAVKEMLAEPSSIPAEDQRLIYKGQILRDERTVESYAIGNDHVLHLVRGKPSGNSQSATAACASTPAAASAGVTGGGISSGAAAGGMPGPLGGLMSPEAMQQLMQSPLMQRLLNNPALMHNMLQMNPAVRELMDRDPQMAQLLNNPELLRDSMNLISNPNLMREYMRNNDRALSNIEALPGGFNALRQLYENVQEPLLNATTGPDSNPFASFLPQAGADVAAGTDSSAAAGTTSTTGSGAAAGGAADQPGSAPLPNPWAPQQGGAAGGAGTGASARVGMPDMSALLGSLGGAGGGLGGLPGLGGPNSNVAEMTTRMLEDPAMRESMISMMSQPGMMDMIAASNPQLNQMLNAMPGIRETMQNPEMLRMMLNPDMMRMAMGMGGGLGGGAGAAGGGAASGASGAGGAGGLFDPAMLASMLGGAAGGAPGSAGAGGPAGLEGLMGMLNAIQMGGGLGAGFGAPPPVTDPATTYATQIQQLQDMGFFDSEANIRALQATGGNVNAAVERLLQNF